MNLRVRSFLVLAKIIALVDDYLWKLGVRCDYAVQEIRQDRAESAPQLLNHIFKSFYCCYFNRLDFFLHAFQ